MSAALPPTRSAAGPPVGSVTDDDRRQRQTPAREGARQYWPIRRASNNPRWLKAPQKGMSSLATDLGGLCEIFFWSATDHTCEHKPRSPDDLVGLGNNDPETAGMADRSVTTAENFGSPLWSLPFPWADPDPYLTSSISCPLWEPSHQKPTKSV